MILIPIQILYPDLNTTLNDPLILSVTSFALGHFER